MCNNLLQIVEICSDSLWMFGDGDRMRLVVVLCALCLFCFYWVVFYAVRYDTIELFVWMRITACLRERLAVSYVCRQRATWCISAWPAKSRHPVTQISCFPALSARGLANYCRSVHLITHISRPTGHWLRELFNTPRTTHIRYKTRQYKSFKCLEATVGYVLCSYATTFHSTYDRNDRLQVFNNDFLLIIKMLIFSWAS